MPAGYALACGVHVAKLQVVDDGLSGDRLGVLGRATHAVSACSLWHMTPKALPCCECMQPVAHDAQGIAMLGAS
jgi:hypothetical protein